MVFTGDHGKPSETRFRILETFAEATLVEASPITGRTHQIRVHCQHAGHPIAGDPKYQDIEFNEKIHKEAGLDRLFLHAQSIRFIDPDSGDYCRFEAPLDSRLATTLEQLRRAV